VEGLCQPRPAANAGVGEYEGRPVVSPGDLLRRDGPAPAVPDEDTLPVLVAVGRDVDDVVLGAGVQLAEELPLAPDPEEKALGPRRLVEPAEVEELL